MKPKLIICGHGRHGKDTMAGYLVDVHGFTAVASSIFAAEKLVFPLLKEKYGYKTATECFHDRYSHRAEWFNIISNYCRENPSKLTQEIFKESDIYVGLRNRAELEASRKYCDVVIWVDRSRHLAPENKDSNEITPEMCDVIIDNNGTLEEFYDKIDKFLIWKYYGKDDVLASIDGLDSWGK